MKLANSLCVLLVILEYPSLTCGGFFFPSEGEITPMNPLALVNEVLQLNCTVFKDSNLNVSMIFWEDYNDTRIPESNVIPDGERTLLFRKNITSVKEEGMYKCRKLDDDGKSILVGFANLVIEYEAVRDVTEFSCILRKSLDEFTCSWKLGLYHHPSYINVTASVSLDNSNLQPCPMDMESKESCTMNSNDGNIYSMTRIAILNITNMRYNVYRKFRKDFNTRDITKYEPTKSIEAVNHNFEDCKCADVSWQGIPGDVETSSRVALKSKWEVTDTLIDVERNTSLTVCDLVPASTYKIKIQLKPRGGMYYSDSNQTSFVTCSTAPSMGPSVYPSGYFSNKCETTSAHRKITVYWQRIPGRYQNGNLTNYKISSGSLNRIIGPENSFGEIQIPCQDHIAIHIEGCNNKGCSPQSTITIPQDGDATPPTKLVMERLNDSGVQLTWFGGEGQRASDIVWCKGRPTSLQCQDEINLLRQNGIANYTVLQSGDINNIAIDDVIFGVAIINDRQLSSGIAWQDPCRYQRNLVPRKITDLSLLTDAPEDSLIVSWFPILCDTVSVNNVYIHSYKIIYCQLDSNNNCVDRESVVQIVANSNTQHTLRDLLADVNYGVWVQAVSLTTEGPKSNMVSGRPINNDLSSGVVAGITVAGIFVFILVLAGGVCILRNARRKLGLGETFPIHIPELESKHPYMHCGTNPSAPSNGYICPIITSNGTKESSQSVQSQNDHSINSHEWLLQHLTAGYQGKQSHPEGPLLKMTAISTQMDQGRERDDRSMSPTDTSEVKEEKEIKKMKPKDVLPPGYTKASTVATTCVHEVERLSNDRRIDSNSKETTASLGENTNERETSHTIFQGGNPEEMTLKSQNTIHNTPLDYRALNDGSYVIHDGSDPSEEKQHFINDPSSRHPTMDSQNLAENNLQNVEEQCSSISNTDNLTSNDETRVVSQWPPNNRDDYVGMDFCTNGNIPVIADTNLDNSIRCVSHDSSAGDKQSTDERSITVEMCYDYV
ncbi:uncharacterized protein LOC125668376 [Ostrea edulis]|uniref:uncharacterized protein LOC125668376 n=1 Tax=Ostrea edulis TaxID=37623 RepID=UPI0024AF7699|nr:uncharacterized protein LOC125668376 [Ostrea edulis]